MISSMKKKKVAGSPNTNNGPMLGGPPSNTQTATNFGVADQATVFAAPNSFISCNAQTRIIFLENYVSKGEKSIIVLSMMETNVSVKKITCLPVVHAGPCPTGLVTNPTRKACLCKDPKQYWSAAKFCCQTCPMPTLFIFQ
jgi:hypothetical protein